jgi:Trk-type K+ transport system membrane component
LFSSILTLVAGIYWYLSPLKYEEKLTGYKEGYILIVGMWLAVSLFSTLPYLFKVLSGSFYRCLFRNLCRDSQQQVATVFDDPDLLPKGLYSVEKPHSMLGGIGFILISLLVLPSLKL